MKLLPKDIRIVWNKDIFNVKLMRTLIKIVKLDNPAAWENITINGVASGAYIDALTTLSTTGKCKINGHRSKTYKFKG